MWTIITSDQTKANKEITHAGKQLRREEDLAPCMLVLKLFPKNPPTEMGKSEELASKRFIIQPQNWGGQMLV